GQFCSARNGTQLGAACVRHTNLQVFFRAVTEDPWHRREGFGVVDGGRLAVQAKACRERRFEARLPLLALQRFQQSGFFPANVRAIPMESVELEVEPATQDVVAEEASLARLA